MLVRDAAGETESALLHEAVPGWVADVVIDRNIPRFIKIPFFLLPHPMMVKQDRMKKVCETFVVRLTYQIFIDATHFQDRLIANEFIQCRKVCEHVLDKILMENPTTGNGTGVNSSQNSDTSEQIPAEDKIELLCNDVVCDPSMDLRTVKHFIWKQSGDLTFYYKTKPNFS